MRPPVLLAALFAIVACTADEKPKAVKKHATFSPGQWVTVGEEKRISDTEDMRLLRFPFPKLPTDDSLDTVCILYRNHEFKTTQIVCPEGAPDISGLDLGVDPQR